MQEQGWREEREREREERKSNKENPRVLLILRPVIPTKDRPLTVYSHKAQIHGSGDARLHGA